MLAVLGDGPHAASRVLNSADRPQVGPRPVQPVLNFRPALVLGEDLLLILGVALILDDLVVHLLNLAEPPCSLRAVKTGHIIS